MHRTSAQDDGLQTVRSLLRPQPLSGHSTSSDTRSHDLTTAWTSPSAGHTHYRSSASTDVDGRVEVHLGAFGAVGKMTAETVDYLLHVLEDRKQELLVRSGDRPLRVGWRDHVDTGAVDVSQKVRTLPASEAARVQLNCSTEEDDNEADDDHVAGLVRSHSYEALVQLEGILEARHHRIMNDGLLESLPADIS
ncbi:unnamed protein product [Hyaloperonospora brassicae]|uniref:Uncharacterized protein n=1 Tax=Hyaloperonospora brassicae TaxID=162125 RepID=A0AAV0T2Q5_HYABA|nr:unnamed protein product [Hyaloperonospora brassicae]